MNRLVGLTVIVAVLIASQVRQASDVGVLSPRPIECDAGNPPSEHLKTTVEAKKIEGASVMLGGVLIDSLEGEDPVCDIVRFVLKNNGPEAIVLSAPYDRPEAPFLTFEALVDDKWTSVIPFKLPNGKQGTRGPTAYKYPVKHVTVESNGEFCFPVHVERWRFSVVQKLRIEFLISRDSKSVDEEETVTSNAFAIK